MDVPDLYCLREQSDDLDDEVEIAKEEARAKQKGKYSKHVGYLRQMYQRSQANTAQAKRIIDMRDDDVLMSKRKPDILSDLVWVTLIHLSDL